MTPTPLNKLHGPITSRQISKAESQAVAKLLFMTDMAATFASIEANLYLNPIARKQMRRATEMLKFVATSKVPNWKPTNQKGTG